VCCDTTGIESRGKQSFASKQIDRTKEKEVNYRRLSCKYMATRWREHVSHSWNIIRFDKIELSKIRYTITTKLNLLKARITNEPRRRFFQMRTQTLENDKSLWYTESSTLSIVNDNIFDTRVTNRGQSREHPIMCVEVLFMCCSPLFK